MASKESIDIFVLTGELSGDILGYNLLKDANPELKIEGVIGPNLKKLPIKEILPMDSLNFMGLSKPFISIFKLVSTFIKIRNHILKASPKIALLIDLPDINLRMAKSLRKKGFKGKIIQVVCPTIWAWRPKRKATLEKYYDHLFCLFPFEKELFKDSPLKVSYIGHPLNSIIPAENKEEKNIIAIFPGSRKQEVDILLPMFLEVCKRFPNFKIHVSVAKDSLLSCIKKYTENHDVVLRGPDEKDALIQDASFACAKNGTINLELALSHVPQISSYSITGIERFIFSNFFSLYLPHYSLPNILLKKRIIPELIGPFANIKNITSEFTALIKNPLVLESMKDDYKRLSTYIKKYPTQNPQEILENQL
jgi:lipid-A-disaccharide synthase